MILPPPMDQNFNHTINILILHVEDAGDIHFTKACKIQFVFFSVPGICEERIACSLKWMFNINDAAGSEKARSSRVSQGFQLNVDIVSLRQWGSLAP